MTGTSFQALMTSSKYVLTSPSRDFTPKNS